MTEKASIPTPEELRVEAQRLIAESIRQKAYSEELMRKARGLLEAAAAAAEKDDAPDGSAVADSQGAGSPNP